VRVIARSTLQLFSVCVGSKDRSAVKAALDAWHREALRGRWKTPAAVLKQYANASIAGAGRVVFNIKGNDYRLVVAINYRKAIALVKWFGSHKDYDKIDVRTVRYEH
jgi:mRNA interferase HigB